MGVRKTIFVSCLTLASQAYGQTVSYKVPHDINPDTGPSVTEQTAAFAKLSWETFIALNWPAEIGPEGLPVPSPDTSKTPIYQDGAYPTVWEAWPEARDVFLPNGATPAQWAEPHNFPDACSTVTIKGPRPSMLLHSVSKGGDVLDEFVQAFRMGPVIDSNGEYVRFGINFNKPMFDYIYDNDLYNSNGQKTFSESHPDGADFPRGVYSSEEVGAIMVKSSWKILGEGDVSGLFHRITVLVYNPPQPDAQEKCVAKEVALTGFHISHRTNSAPQWIWATFEHISNAPSWGAVTGQEPLLDHYSFFDLSKCEIVSKLPTCDYNSLPPRPWDPEVPGQEQTMVIRTGAIPLLIKNYNTAFRSLLEDTPWSNYFLVNVQWPTKVIPPSGGTGPAEVNPAYPDGSPEPSFLANSTMETFVQGFVPEEVTSNSNLIPLQDTSIFDRGTTGGAQRNTSSCVNCHGDASMTTGVPGNFVFSLNRAEPQ